MTYNNESICRHCFHSYVCEQFNEHKDDNNKKCHFFNDHFVPTSDVVEVKHGYWKECETEDHDGYEHHYCSICNAIAYFHYETEPVYDENSDGDMEFITDLEVGIWENLTKYCPNCGAKMDGEE